jgi:excisionase family DNA binding protein
MTPMPAADEPEYLKVEEVAARLKLKEKTIRDWILRGELPAYKLARSGASAATTSIRRCRHAAPSQSPHVRADSGIQMIPDSPQR